MQRRTDPLGQEYILIPAGEYGIGSDGSGSHPNESPFRKVKLDSEIWISIRPVLQSVWSEVCGSNPSRFCDGFEAGLRPVERVDWISANNFGDRLAVFLESTDGWHNDGIFRLPSEAEWEIAARAGTKSEWYSGDADRDIHEHVWNAGNSGGGSKVVAQKEANPWGVHDICGNVAEWCLDTWHDDYNGAPSDASAWLAGGDPARRVHRGGSWFTESEATRSAARASAEIDRVSDGIGSRLVWQAL